jgi:hypothetical protein
VVCATLAALTLLVGCAEPAAVPETSTTVGSSAVLGDPPGFVSANGVLTLEPTTTTTTTVAAHTGVCSRPEPAVSATTIAPATTTTTTTTTTTVAPRRTSSTTTTTTVPAGMPGEVVVVGGPDAAKVAASLARRLKPLPVRTDATTDVVRALAVLSPKPNALVFVIDPPVPASHTEYTGQLAALCSLAEHVVWVADWRTGKEAWAGAVRTAGGDILDFGPRLDRQPGWVAADGSLTDVGVLAIAALLEPEARSPLP